jgi:hypothetical protein
MLGLEEFTTIPLERLPKKDLMERVDRKYLTSITKLPQIFQDTRDFYDLQEVSGKTVCCYSSVYFDTDDYIMYLQHQNGKLNRLKIRTREYIDTNDAFLEIKIKNNKGITNKIRIRTNELRSIDDTQSRSFICNNTPFNPSDLLQTINSRYKRITLVSKFQNERVTLDFDLKFDNMNTNNHSSFGNICIIEIKTERYTVSPMVSYLKTIKVPPCSLSKYCLGTALTESSVKSNNYKAKIISLYKINNIDHEKLS